MKQLFYSLTLLFALFSYSAFAQINSQGGYALKFDGSNDYVQINNTGHGVLGDNSDNESFTIETWFKYAGSGSFEKIFAKHSDGAGTSFMTGFFMERLNTNQIQIGYAKLGVQYEWYRVEGTINIKDGKWHHLVYVYDNAGSISLYVDGVHEGTTSGVSAKHAESSINFRMMDSQKWPGKTAGQLDEFRIWNTARTEAQILANMYKELQGNEAGLVAYYKMSEGSGTSLTDNSSNNYTGTVVNGPTWKYSGCLGGSKQALDFDGSNEYVNCGNGASLQISGTALTLEAWINASSFSGGYWENSIIDKHNDLEKGYGLRCGGAGILSFNIGNGSTWYDILSPEGTLKANQWHHVAGVYDGSHQYIYVDGILVNTNNTNISISANTTTNFYIGGSVPFPNREFAGKIDEVRIWNTARTQTQIHENMMKTLTGNEAGLAAYYRMDQYNGTTLYDMTSNGNNGTLTNMNISDWVASTAFNTWIGADDDSWTNAANWTNGAPVSGQSFGLYNTSTGITADFSSALTYGSIYLGTPNTMNLNTGAQVTFTGSIINKGTVNVNSPAGLGESGSLIAQTGIINTGTMTADRFIVQDRWHLIASPVASSINASSCFAGDYVYDYDPTAGNQNDAWNGISTVENGKGYLIKSTANGSHDVTFTGTFNAGNTTIIDNASVNTTGYHLVGNPYTSAIDWNAASGWTKTNISGTFYIWNNTNYATWNGATGANGGTRYIPAMQGFFVQRTVNAGNLECTSAVQVHSTTDFMKSNIENLLRMQTTGNGFSDEVVVYEDQGENDAKKFYSWTENLPQMAFELENKEYSILKIADFQQTIPVNYTCDIDGSYSIRFTENTFSQANITLIDLVNNTTTEVNENTIYNFDYTTSDINPRFNLVIEPNTSNIDIVNKNNFVAISQEQGSLTIYHNDNSAIVELFDITGKKIINKNLISGESISGLSSGIYVIKYSTDTQAETKKLFVR